MYTKWDESLTTPAVNDSGDAGRAHLSFQVGCLYFELGGISIQSCKGKVRRVCTRRPFLHTNKSLSPDSNEKRPLCVWSSSQSLHAFAIDWLDAWEIGGRGNAAKQQDIRSNETLIKVLKTSRWRRGSSLKGRYVVLLWECRSEPKCEA